MVSKHTKALLGVCLGCALLGAPAWAQDQTISGQAVADQAVSGQAVAEQPPAPPALAAAPVAPAPEPVLPPVIVPTDPGRSFWSDLVSPRALLATAPGTILDQIHEFPTEWGTGVKAAEKRAASLYGQFVIGDLLERGVRAIDHESNRYKRLAAGNFFRRTGHAIAFTVVARTPNGFSPAYATLANDYGSWALATLWSPRSLRTADSIVEWGTGNVGVRAGGNFIREFWPDVKSLFRKHKN